MKKIIIVLFIIGIGIYIIYVHTIFNESEYVYYSPQNRYFLVVTKKEPIMSFGSGKRELRLFTSFYLYLGKCTMGEFPIEIEKWDIDCKTINIRIPQHHISNISYVKQYTDRNTNIGMFKLFYNIEYVPWISP